MNSVNSNVVGFKYFQTLGIAFSQGRDFNAQDTEERPRVVVVNEAFVRRHLPGQEALGKRLSFNGTTGPWQAIVGVVRDSKYLDLAEAPAPVVYVSLSQNHETGMALHVRAAVDPPVIAAAIRREVQALERNLPVSSPVRMSESIDNSLYAARMGAVLLAVFGSLALLLSSVGLYGVMSFTVARRTRELGIRVALGAQRADVFRLVLKQGMALVLVGIVVGLAGSAVVTRLLTSFLYGVSATDSVTFASIPVVLAIVGLLACYVPARRAMKVDPLVALSYE
jgi:putative ABC transport system permease protein